MCFWAIRFHSFDDSGIGCSYGTPRMLRPEFSLIFAGVGLKSLLRKWYESRQTEMEQT